MSEKIKAYTVIPQQGAHTFPFIEGRNRDYLQQLSQYHVYGWNFQGGLSEKNIPQKNEDTYFMPSQTVLEEEAQRIGMDQKRGNYYGAIVGEPFQLTKSTMHPLVSKSARRPDGWSDEFARKRRKDRQLAYTVFGINDMVLAINNLKEGKDESEIRVKDALESGGRGQTVVKTPEEIDRLIDKIKRKRLAELHKYGFTVEKDLKIKRTISIGRSQIGGDVFSYYGTQRQKKEGRSFSRYEGTDLWKVVKGELKALAELEDVPEDIKELIKQIEILNEDIKTDGRMFPTRLNIDLVEGWLDDGELVNIEADPGLKPGGAPDVPAIVSLKQHTGQVEAHSYQRIQKKGGVIFLPEHIVSGSAIRCHFRDTDPEYIRKNPEGREVVVYSIVNRKIV